MSQQPGDVMDTEKPVASPEPPAKVIKHEEAPVEVQRGNTRLIRGDFHNIDYTTPLGEQRQVPTYRVYRPAF